MRHALGILLVGVLFYSCTTDSLRSQAEKELIADVEEIRQYLTTVNEEYKHDSNTGIFWRITQENADGRKPNTLNTVHLAWTISTLAGKELHKVSATDSSFFNYYLNPVFTGFVLSLNALKEGEKGRFYIPSPYAYADAPPASFVGLNLWDPIRLDLEVIKMYSETEFMDYFAHKNQWGTPEINDKGVRVYRTEPKPNTADIKKDDALTVKYKGHFLDKDKTVFDQGEFKLIVGAGGAIQGFEQALLMMKLGEKVKVIIPSQYAYGTTGQGKIPPNTTLAFELEARLQ
jgi:FKBP-type peptidyl-prolyl cis-trans isomerase